MSSQIINVLLTSFTPSTPRKVFHVSRQTPTTELRLHIVNHLTTLYPCLPTQLLSITTFSGHPLPVLSTVQNDFLPIRVSLLQPGGKGGFGSQLRAQGGRMASRKKRSKNAEEDEKGACRDLSGRRLKSHKEARELAEFLAKQPILERRAREEKKRKLQELIDMPNPGVRRGKMEDGAEYFENVEKGSEAVRSAVREVLQAAKVAKSNERPGDKLEAKKGVKRTMQFTGWDDEFTDSEEEKDDEIEGKDESEDNEENSSSVTSLDPAEGDVEAENFKDEK